MQLPNLLLASGVNVYALAFMLGEDIFDILSTCCDKYNVM